MIKKAFLTLILFALALSTISAQSTTRFELSPYAGFGFGYTEYEMDVQFSFEGDLLRVRSLLEFPLNTEYFGINAKLIGEPQGYQDWSVSLKALTNLSDPSNKMFDHDWESANGAPLEKFSYTESNSELTSYIIELLASKNIYSGTNSSINFQLGFNYYHYDYDIIDLEGWQIVEDVTYNFSSTEKGIIYRVNYYFPYGGAQFKLDQVSFSMGLNLGLGPVLYSDFDDHLLRNKDATATGTGIGLTGGAFLRKSFGDINSRNRPFFELSADVNYFNTTGDQVQRWYGDDPATPDDDDTGTISPELPHDVRSLYYRVGLSAGITF